MIQVDARILHGKTVQAIRLPFEFDHKLTRSSQSETILPLHTRGVKDFIMIRSRPLLHLNSSCPLLAVANLTPTLKSARTERSSEWNGKIDVLVCEHKGTQRDRSDSCEPTHEDIMPF